MDTLHSGYELNGSQNSSARRYSTYIENSAVERLHNTEMGKTSFEQLTYSSIGTAPVSRTTEPSTAQPTFGNESDIELRAIDPYHNEMHITEPEFSLPPVDGGKDAWLFLFAAFILEILVWGNYYHPICA